MTKSKIEIRKKKIRTVQRSINAAIAKLVELEDMAGESHGEFKQLNREIQRILIITHDLTMILERYIEGGS